MFVTEEDKLMATVAFNLIKESKFEIKGEHIHMVAKAHMWLKELHSRFVEELKKQQEVKQIEEAAPVAKAKKK